MSEKGQGVDIQIDEGMAIDEHGNEVVVDLRSDFILDAAGETVDSGAVGLAPPPTGQGTPGGRPD